MVRREARIPARQENQHNAPRIGRHHTIANHTADRLGCRLAIIAVAVAARSSHITITGMLSTRNANPEPSHPSAEGLRAHSLSPDSTGNGTDTTTRTIVALDVHTRAKTPRSDWHVADGRANRRLEKCCTTVSLVRLLSVSPLKLAYVTLNDVWSWWQAIWLG